VKPLTEWTTDDLRYSVFWGESRDESLAELIRRAEAAMKEKCAAECDTVAIEAESGADYEGSHWAYECGKRLRALP
jgi:hypothetical protein